MRRLGLFGSILVAIGAFFASGVPVFGADQGTVNATVSTNDAACITITSNPISYGTLEFSTSTLSTATGLVQTVASCSNSAQTLRAQGTNATNGNATWALASSLGCPGSGPDLFVHEVKSKINSSFLPLSTNQTATVASLAAQPSSATNIETQLTMPCSNSSGRGTTMSMSIIFIASVP